MRYLLLVSLCLFANAQEWHVEGSKYERQKHFLKMDESRQKQVTSTGYKASSSCYYKNAIVSSQTCYRQTGNILVTFGKKSKVNYEEYALKHQLILLKVVNPMYKTVLYSAEKHQGEIIAVVNELNKNEKKSRARVEWLTPRVIR